MATIQTAALLAGTIQAQVAATAALSSNIATAVTGQALISASIKALAQRDKQVVQATQLKCAAQTANGRQGRIATPKMDGMAAATMRAAALIQILYGMIIM